jgi:hypothetical protein
METLAWLVVYVVAFGLLQLVLFRYFQRDDPAPETTPSMADHGGGARADSGTERRGDDTGVRCRHCGTVNERHATITFCRYCVSPLA